MFDIDAIHSCSVYDTCTVYVNEIILHLYVRKPDLSLHNFDTSILDSKSMKLYVSFL